MAGCAVRAEQPAAIVVWPCRGLLQRFDVGHEILDALANPGVRFEHAEHRAPHRHLRRPVWRERACRPDDELADAVSRKCAVIPSRDQCEVGGSVSETGATGPFPRPSLP